MRHLSAAVLFLCLAGQTFAQPILPDPPAPPPPTPPAPTPQVLSSGMLYPIKSATPFQVVASPDGLVKVVQDTGPIKVLAVFVGGNGSLQTITFTEKYLAFVSPVQTGTVELIVIAQDGTIQRRTLSVQVGPAPPPPGPIPPPTPTDPLFPSLQAAFAKESAADKALLPRLVQLYKTAVTYATTTTDPNVKTVGDLVAKIANARKDPTMLGTALPNLRAVEDAELQKQLPYPTTQPLDAATRVAIAAQFQRLGALTAALGVQK